jgi:hypothetical protein
MENNLQVIFKTEDLKQLLENNSEYIVINSFLESVVLKDGSKAGALRVYAEAVNTGGATMGRVEGCPVPPCNVNG